MYFLSVVKDRIKRVPDPEREEPKRVVVLKQTKSAPKTLRQVKKQEEFVEYKRLLTKVSTKIEDWRRSMTLRKQSKEFKDEDFVDLQPSPTKFHSR